MTINVLQLILIIVFASLAYWANEQLNKVPQLLQIVRVLIVVLAVVLIVGSLFGGFGAHITIH